MSKFICIHGHFYQPPRENAWLEEIELQESAYPYHDWNERINAECYRPNSVSRILDGGNKIIDIVNNYGKISFNFGPTLLSWLKEQAPDTYEAIQEGDRLSQELFNGHGSAIAQVYNHIIMPLASERDKETQVVWGIRDFVSHFGRYPEGMWLAETAADLDTLDILAKHNIKFTVLAPNQAKRFREIGGKTWQEGVNTRKPYICQLPSGRSITLFFYDGAISQAIAFKGLLKNGKDFAEYLINSFNDEEDSVELVHVATDGESYGHHHRYGDMALAYCLRQIQESTQARITNYSEFLSLYEPEYEVEIHDNSSWSCAHGVERWRSNCGCNTGGYQHWNQEWRTPLRESLDWLGDEIARLYEKEMSPYNPNPWELRNRYIEVILNRNQENALAFIEDNSVVPLSEHGKTRFMRLLEMQRHALLMFTSCAWFFDEVSGIETVQVLQYANRAIQLCERVADVSLEPAFLEHLQKALSNIPENQDGAEIYRRFTAPARIDLKKVGMHYAVASLFAEEPETMDVLNYTVLNEYFERHRLGIQRLAIGRTTVYSKITLSQQYFSFAVVYLGQHQIIGSFTNKLSRVDYLQMAEKIKYAFKQSNFAEVLQVMQGYFPFRNFSLWDLFKDEKIKVVKHILRDNLEDAEDAYHNIYEKNINLMNIMQSGHMQIPPILLQNVQVVINKDIENFFQNGNLNPKRLSQITDTAKKWHVELDHNVIGHLAEKRLLEMVEDLYHIPGQPELLDKIIEIIHELHKIDIQPDLQRPQNLVFKMCNTYVPRWKAHAQEDERIDRLRRAFGKLCDLMNIRVQW